MPLYPVSTQYYDEKNQGILIKMETSYAESITLNQTMWTESDIDQRFECGDQTIWSEVYGSIPIARRHVFSFNRIRRVINMVSGRQRQVRKSIVAVPIENADNQTADQLTKVITWCMNQECMLDTISEAFHNSLVTGMNLLQVWVDYRNDPVSGNIKLDTSPPNSFLIDPYFRKHDLSDCNFIWKRSFITKAEALSILPDKEEEIIDLAGYASGNGRDGKFTYLPESYNYSIQNLLSYDEYYYKDYRSQKMLVDAETGETLEWKSTNDEGLAAFLEMYPQVTMIEQQIPTVRMAIVLQNKVMYDGPNVLGIDTYPFIGVFAHYTPQLPYYYLRVQGMVRMLRDPQFLFNRRKQIELDYLEAGLNGGWKVKEGSLIDPNDVYQQAGQGKGLFMTADSDMNDAQQIIPPQLPPTTLQVSQLMGEEISQISGVNEELLGSSQDDKAGILSMLRQNAGLTTLQIYFDQLDRSQKLLGKLIIDVIQANFTPGKIKKILEGEEPTQQFHNKAFGRYHAEVEDGLNTATQRQMQFAQMLQLKELGVPITPADLLEAATLQNKDRIIKNLEAAEKAQQQQAQAQAQMAMELQKAQIELALARAKADLGLYLERSSRVEENRALAIQKISEANSDQERALLDKIKAMKELEGLDISHIEQLINMTNALKSQEIQNTQAYAQEAESKVVESPVNEQ